ncbi:MAG: T9SS type A sorting domain-containing protein [Bacteroidetes bacterium]|nr:T9SS type A sorting domain-containing protein [Bacteroidota bacterium]
MKKILTTSTTAKIVLFLFLFLNITIYSQTDLKSKIGQMIMVGFSGTSVPDSLAYDLQQRNLGGVIFYANNLHDPQQIKNLTSQLKQLSKLPLFMATDQEGGIVARLTKRNGFSNTYTAYQLGTVFNSVDSTQAQAAEMAQWLSSCGINIDFAPVVDVDVNPNSPAIGAYGRSFSKDPLTVFNHASVFINEMHKQNIITSLKHFPGHGSAMTDSHLGFTDITNTWADSELVPYQKLLENNYSDMIMAGHLFNAHIDSLYPASISYNAVTGLLKNKLGFKGIVITDDMLMGAISTQYTFSKAIELAVNAGDDILLFAGNLINNKSIVDSVINIISQKVDDGTIAESTIDTAYNKIINMKQKYLSISLAENDISSRIVPDDFSIANYPNPFNPTTNIIFNVGRSSHVVIKVYNITGQLISELVNQDFAKGNYKVQFDGSRLASGIYFVVMQTPDILLTNKIVLVK